MRQAIARTLTCRIKALPILVVIWAVLAACSFEPISRKWNNNVSRLRKNKVGRITSPIPVRI